MNRLMQTHLNVKIRYKIESVFFLNTVRLERMRMSLGVVDHLCVHATRLHPSLIKKSYVFIWSNINKKTYQNVDDVITSVFPHDAFFTKYIEY